MALHKPNLTLVQYTGEPDRSLWEIRTKNPVVLKTNDLILMDSVLSILMIKKHGFEIADEKLLNFVNESQSVKVADLSEEELKSFIQEYSSNNGCYLISTEEFNAVKEPLEKIKSFITENMPYELENTEESIEDKVIRLLDKTLTQNESNTTNEVLKEIIASDNQENTSKDEQNKKDEYNPPYLEDLESLTLEELKTACLHFNITVGNKRIETLKSMLLPYLKSKDAQ